MEERKIEAAEQEREKREQGKSAREAERKEIESRRALVELEHAYSSSLPVGQEAATHDLPRPITQDDQVSVK